MEDDNTFASLVAKLNAMGETGEPAKKRQEIKVIKKAKREGKKLHTDPNVNAMATLMESLGKPDVEESKPNQLKGKNKLQSVPAGETDGTTKNPSKGKLVGEENTPIDEDLIASLKTQFRDLLEPKTVAEEEPTDEAVGEFAEPLYTLQDELELEDNILVDEMARWMSGQDITEFVENFRRHHEMPEGGHAEESVEAPAEEAIKTEQLSKKKKITNKTPVDMVAEEPVEEGKKKDHDKDGDIDSDDYMAAKDKAIKKSMKEETITEDCSCGHGSDCNCGPECSCGCNAVTEEKIEEAPTMDTTQLITLLRNAGLSEELIQTKLNEWANTPEGAAEDEATSHGEPYENFAQSVNISLKKYLDAENFKVGLKEHTVEEIKEAYKKSKEK